MVFAVVVVAAAAAILKWEHASGKKKKVFKISTYEATRHWMNVLCRMSYGFWAHISASFIPPSNLIPLSPRLAVQQYKYIRANIVLHLADSPLPEVFSSLLTY